MMKIVIITGGGGEIGRATAKIFSDNNYTCVIVDVNKESAQNTIQQLNKSKDHSFFIIDISTPIGIDNLITEVIKRYIYIDVLVNLAATNRKSFSKNDNIEERWDKTINNDLKSVYLLSERVIVEMQKTGGSIVNVGSIAGGFLGSHSLPYAAAKAGIVAITKSHARIYGIHNIRVNCIVPGIIDTSMVHDSFAERKDKYFTKIKECTPLKRWGKAKEIAEAIYFVSSEKCKFMTGSIIIIDGGATLTLGPRLDEKPPFKWEKWPPKLK